MGNCFHTNNYIECPNHAAQTSMKAAHENISLENAVDADTSDSAILDAKQLNQLKGERCHGSGPSSIELEDRSELQQIDCASRFMEKSSIFDDAEAEKSPKENKERCSNELALFI